MKLPKSLQFTLFSAILIVSTAGLVSGFHEQSHSGNRIMLASGTLGGAGQTFQSRLQEVQDKVYPNRPGRALAYVLSSRAYYRRGDLSYSQIAEDYRNEISPPRFKLVNFISGGAKTSFSKNHPDMYPEPVQSSMRQGIESSRTIPTKRVLRSRPKFTLQKSIRVDGGISGIENEPME